MADILLLVQPQPHGRVYNFAAGPATLSVDVLESCQKDMLNWQVLLPSPMRTMCGPRLLRAWKLFPH
jgi:hypothetical protein